MKKYFSVGEMNIGVESDVPMDENTFHEKIRAFEVAPQEKLDICIHHSFSLPDLSKISSLKCIYQRTPWVIYEGETAYFYIGTAADDPSPWIVLAINKSFSSIQAFHPSEERFRKGNLHALTMTPTDQIFFAKILADKEGLMLHSAGINYEGKGAIFMGHSGAGKSTTVEMLEQKIGAEVLCDDRMIVRLIENQVNICGNWHYGTYPTVSPTVVPLQAFYLIKKSTENKLIPIPSRTERERILIPFLINPLTDQDWWSKVFHITEKILDRIPMYELHLDLSGKASEFIKETLQ